jgi:hypothetical protein
MIDLNETLQVYNNLHKLGEINLILQNSYISPVKIFFKVIVIQMTNEANSETGTGYPSVAHELILYFSGVRVTWSFYV